MTIKHFLLKALEGQQPKEIDYVIVPTGSKFLKAVILPDGLHVYYEISELVLSEDQKEDFVLMTPNKPIPEGFTFIDLLSTIVETPEGQAIVVWPLYKRKN